MLFRACTQRLCRPRDQALKQFQRSEIMQSTSFIPLSRWPESLKVAMSLLSEKRSVDGLSTEVHSVNNVNGQQLDSVQAQASDNATAPEKIIAGLDLLGRIKHTPASWSKALPHILNHTGNQVWIIRDHAARIYAANIGIYESFTAIEELLHGLGNSADNERHGRLLAISYVVRGIQSLPQSERAQYLNTKHADFGRTLQQIVTDGNSSPAIRSKAVDILNAFLDLRIGLAPSLEALDVHDHNRKGNSLYSTEKSTVMVSLVFQRSEPC